MFKTKYRIVVFPQGKYLVEMQPWYSFEWKKVGLATSYLAALMVYNFNKYGMCEPYDVKPPELIQWNE